MLFDSMTGTCCCNSLQRDPGTIRKIRQGKLLTSSYGNILFMKIMLHNQKLLVCHLMIAAMLCLIVIPVCAEAAVVTTNPDEATMVMMPIPGKEYRQHVKWYELSPKVLTKNKYFLTSLDLTSYIPYDPKERNQGNISNCWVWAGTGGMELDHSRNDDVMDRLSIQYFDSLYNGGKGDSWAGVGGYTTDFVAFYQKKKIAVPWSNKNAAYEDYRDLCFTEKKSWSVITNTPVSKMPQYPVDAIETYPIATSSVSQGEAIKNIKYPLQHGGAVLVSLYFADKKSSHDFMTFWKFQGEEAVFDFDPYNGQVMNNSESSSHQVLCVGYDDESDSWLMLNDWPTEFPGLAGRPNNLFRIKMHSNYNAELLKPVDTECPGCPEFFHQVITEWVVLKTKFASKKTSYSVMDSVAYFEAGTWYIDLNKDGKLSEKNDLVYRKFGQAGDIPVQGMWARGQGTVAAVFRNGNWFIDSNGNGKLDRGVDAVYRGLGDQKGDVPVVGDWNGDGLDEAGFYRSGQWYLDTNGDGTFDRRNDTYYPQFGGRKGDIPLAGRWYAEDERDYPWIYQGDGTWLIDSNMDGSYNRDTDVTLMGFGNSRQSPVIGDWRGSGSDYPTLYSKGDWQLDTEPPFGTFSDIDEKLSGFGSKESIPVAWRPVIAR